jgi:hypothetical protein
MKTKPNSPLYLDDEEKNLIEGIEAALDAGQIVPPSEAELEIIRAKWQTLVSNTAARKAITLRIPERDIERLKGIARQKGLPYQTLVTSVLHQFANGDLIERPIFGAKN